MPVQAAQWTEFLSCPICYNEFDENVHKPISLGCSHTVCKTCLNKLHRKACPFDQTAINTDIDVLPVNFALLQLVGAQVWLKQLFVLPLCVVTFSMPVAIRVLLFLPRFSTNKWWGLALDCLGVHTFSKSNCTISGPSSHKMKTCSDCNLSSDLKRLLNCDWSKIPIGKQTIICPNCQ